ncbi:pilus assembly protein [Corallococcus exercitus]|uniref:Pilus assembly protein n=1 Tax=Corallococcus exercitus TaxID=2316736 RepID=A0A3A8IRK7_9BACT|nr:TadE family protein [Corallococcus exercitus]NOK34535.1 pilus assembly protein [Corallococcus exercitus]RKG82594.1 pilus assembly protein [Corallococcus exercitus]
MAFPRPQRRQHESGQAAVEAALCMPLVVFMVLGSLQLFMLLQGRILAQVAVYRAVRAGSLNHGSCEAMTHAALVTMLPTVEHTRTPAQLAAAFEDRKRNYLRVRGSKGTLFTEGPMVEIVRESPDTSWVRSLAGDEDLLFDTPTDSNLEMQRRTLEIRMVAWYYMRIPFADWVMSRMFLAQFHLRNYRDANPLNPAQKESDWWADTDVELGPDDWPGGDLGARMVRWSAQGHYLFPIQVHAAMRMMTPVKASNFNGGAGCSLHGF